jgi:hypothetical protein
MDRTTKALLAAVALGLWANALSTWGQPVSAQSTSRLDRVEAREFALVNEDGRVRAVLGIAKEAPTLSFIDPRTGDLGLLVGILPEGATVGVVQLNGGMQNYLSTAR